MRIAVLYGGESEEREISLRSGAAVTRALREQGLTVCDFELNGVLPSEDLAAELSTFDAVFLALHGGAGEDGRLQEYLEQRGIFHYTGSDAAASRLAMDKAAAKERVAACGVPVAGGFCLMTGAKKPDAPPFLPLAVKPLCGGSSIGFSLINSAEEWEKLDSCGPLLCEEYLPGREYSVGILAGRALPPVEILPLKGVYDYRHKYTPGATEELCPAPITPQQRAHLQDLALLAFRALGLRDYARIDFKENARGEAMFLEANTLPGMTKTSLFPLAARVTGLTMGALCVRMAELALLHTSL